ncbi:MAG: flavodoxin domain-containing protein [Bacteroidales bacterium]|nr:flavodoxin domain-containing protein [Bacteroidales bacterium]MCF8403547.1 flavodoxin domain-containing protein [Bacteroidales bacterium]
MNKVLLVFWPREGNVEVVADKMLSRFNNSMIKKITVTDVTVNDLKAYDNWIVGGSTVGSHVWEDADDSNKWFEFFKLLDTVDLKNKVVAFYGLGDQILYPHHFVDGLGVFQEEFEKREVKIIGQTPTEAYNFEDSDGQRDGLFYGLALNEDHEAELTDERLDRWFEQIKKDFN